jgi:hypothetical protein
MFDDRGEDSTDQNVMDTGQVVPAFTLLLISILCLAVLTLALDVFVNVCCGCMLWIAWMDLRR